MAFPSIPQTVYKGKIFLKKTLWKHFMTFKKVVWNLQTTGSIGPGASLQFDLKIGPKLNE